MLLVHICMVEKNHCFVEKVVGKGTAVLDSQGHFEGHSHCVQMQESLGSDKLEGQGT